MAAVALAAAGPPLLRPPAAPGFCGFYVARADTKLFNRASKVVLAREADRTVLTMVNDFEGDAKDFAVVIPVPTVLQKGQIHVGNQASVDHLDAYSAPRLVEYWDPDPCERRRMYGAVPAPAGAARAGGADAARANALGVKVEAEYTVGEYDIVILSARESDGLQTWLTENGYRIPAGAGDVLQSYLRQGIRFFVARVNLAEQTRLGYRFLRPLQIAYESPKFMLPIRLGMVNAQGPQDLFLFVLSPRGRVETTNYRTVKLPSDRNVPLYVKDDFARFYRSLFDRQVTKEDMHAVFLEYAWDMNWCDPCAAAPLSPSELLELGVFWLDDENAGADAGRAGTRRRSPVSPGGGGGVNVFLTRLHVRYDAAHFPEDLAFQQTGDRTNFQGRFVLNHPWTGSGRCPAARDYRRDLARRHREEAANLADLTGWDLQEIYRKMEFNPDDDNAGEEGGPGARPWWRKLWGR